MSGAMKIKKNIMSEEEFNEYLESIGGLVNGFYPNRDLIKTTSSFFVGNGWLSLIKELIDKLIEDGWDKQILQVKEKFGTLRFYTNGGGENHIDIIRDYESRSASVCEVCGEEATLRSGGWVSTLCDEHFKESKENKENGE